MIHFTQSLDEQVSSRFWMEVSQFWNFKCQSVGFKEFQLICLVLVLVRHCLRISFVCVEAELWLNIGVKIRFATYDNNFFSHTSVIHIMCAITLFVQMRPNLDIVQFKSFFSCVWGWSLLGWISEVSNVLIHITKYICNSPSIKSLFLGGIYWPPFNYMEL